MTLMPENQSDSESFAPQLPSLVDVVFILLIFFLVLSVLGIGIVETGEHSEDIHDKEQELSDFPSVTKALRKDMTDFLILSLNMTEDGRPQYLVFSSTSYYDKIIGSIQEYETVRSTIEAGGIIFENATQRQQIEILQDGWGPFPDAASMRRCEVALKVMGSESNLIIQANERFTYHQILEIMQLFNQFEAVYFEVIENDHES